MPVPRLVPDWINEYVKFYGAVAESPESYHFWSAATTIAAALKRHVWVSRGTYRLFPNLYTILVGKPGLGKGAALIPAMNVLKESKAAHILSGRITIEWVLERLAKGFSGPVPVAGGNGSMTLGTESAAILFSPEFNVFVTASAHTLKILTDLWDSREGIWDYGTRHSGEYSINEPCVTLLAGCTPDSLIELLPSASVSGGFSRRVNFIYAADTNQLIPWPTENLPVHDGLWKDLRSISLLYGKFKWEPAATHLFEDYYRKTRGNMADFKDEATAGYETSMFAHAIKLAMILSVSRGDDLTISVEDWKEAEKRIDACSQTVKRVFRATGSSNYATVTDRFIRYLEVRGVASRQDVLANNWQHMNAQDLDMVVATLVSSNIIEEIYQGSKVLYRLK